MSLTRGFQCKIRAVVVRCSLNLFLRQVGLVLMTAGVVAALAILAERMLAIEMVTPQRLWVFLGAMSAAILVLGVRALPNRMQVSLLLDERLGLRERSSTTLALANSDDPFARAARAESLKAVENVNLRGHFPIRLSRSWYYGAATWLLIIAMIRFLPPKDLLGLARTKKEQTRQVQQVEQARAEVQETAKSVKAVVEKLDAPSLAEDLKKLGKMAKQGQPQEVKREAIKVLGDLSEKLKQMQASSSLEAANALGQMLKQLRGSTNPFSQQLRLALATGHFAKAGDMLSQLRKQLGEGTLSDEKRKELARQLQQLAKELGKLAERRGQIEDELERLGLDRNLAQADAERLRQALQAQGLSADRIEQIVKKMEASGGACALCAGLGQGFAGIGAGGDGMGIGDLSGAIDQLNALDALQQQAIALRASLDEVSRCVSCLGQGMSGRSEHWCVGEGGGQGKGIGLSSAPHSMTSDPLTADRRTRAASRAGGRDPVVASWYFKGARVTGEARRSFVEVVQAGRASAADAISENEIPRRYEDAVKSYFNQLEESGSEL